MASNIIIRTLSPIRHNGVKYKAGEQIEGLGAADAKRLVELGVAERVAQPKVVKGGTGGNSGQNPQGGSGGGGGGNNGQNPQGANGGGPE